MVINYEPPVYSLAHTTARDQVVTETILGCFRSTCRHFVLWPEVQIVWAVGTSKHLTVASVAEFHLATNKAINLTMSGLFAVP
jgi:hypothetical protein